MAHSQVYLGARVSVECDFRLAGVLTDPAAVSCLVRAPSGNLATYTYPTGMSRDAAGVYRCEFTVTEAGSYAARFEGSGIVEAVDETFITVLQSNVI